MSQYLILCLDESNQHVKLNMSAVYVANIQIDNKTLYVKNKLHVFCLLKISSTSCRYKEHYDPYSFTFVPVLREN